MEIMICVEISDDFGVMGVNCPNDFLLSDQIMDCSFSPCSAVVCPHGPLGEVKVKNLKFCGIFCDTMVK